jgi:hypothetical protein
MWAQVGAIVGVKGTVLPAYAVVVHPSRVYPGIYGPCDSRDRLHAITGIEVSGTMGPMCLHYGPNLKVG